MTAWRKASSCHANGTCVEVAALPAGVGVRDAKFPQRAVLLLTPAVWSALSGDLRRSQ